MGALFSKNNNDELNDGVEIDYGMSPYELEKLKKDQELVKLSG